MRSLHVHFALDVREVEAHGGGLDYFSARESGEGPLDGSERVLLSHELSERLLFDDAHVQSFSTRRLFSPSRLMRPQKAANPSRFSTMRAKRFTATGPLGMLGRAPRP